MGDDEKTPLKLDFDSKVRVEFRGATITSDAGLLACRELDDALSLTDSADEFLKESRTGKNILHQLIPLLRQSVYSRLAGYDDTNDADRLSQDPALRVVVGWKGPDRNAASTSEMGRFETELLTQKENLKGIERLNVEWIKRTLAKTVHRRIIWTSTVRRVRCMASRRKQPTTATLDACAITPCSASTSLEIAKGRFSDQATSTAPMAGRSSSIPSSSAT